MSELTNNQQSQVYAQFGSIQQGNFTDKDTQSVLNNESSIVSKGGKGPLKAFSNDIKTMCSMVKAWAKKEYRNIPKRSIGMVILTLGYVLLPFDLIPDLPPLGLLDDAAMVSLCLKAIHDDLQDFRNWQMHR